MRQVPLLLALGEGDRALDAALASGDPDLAHLALFAVFRARPLPEFLAALAARPAARVLFEAYCARQVGLGLGKCGRFHSFSTGRSGMTMRITRRARCASSAPHSLLALLPGVSGGVGGGTSGMHAVRDRLCTPNYLGHPAHPSFVSSE